MKGKAVPERYVDPEGVERGYYVYAHADLKTKKIFYVGKGHGARAWDRGRRSQAWKDHVAALPDGYEVTLLKTDLSELEAFEEEKLAIEFHGGHAADGGSLINWIPGGEVLGFEISIPQGSTDENQDTTYWDTRKFKKLARHEQETIARNAHDQMASLLEKWQDFAQKAERKNKNSDISSIQFMEGMLYAIQEAATNLVSRRISWTAFCFAIEEELDQLELVDDEDLTRRTKPLLAEAVKVTKSLLSQVDSGNRQEAESASIQEWIKRNGGDAETALRNLRERVESLGIDWPSDDSGDKKTPSRAGNSSQPRKKRPKKG